MYRVAFDPALPVVAAQPFTAAGQPFSAKDPVDWRKLGINEAVLFDWWRAGLVVHPLPETPKADEPPPGFTAGGSVDVPGDGPAVVAFDADTLRRGPVVEVETPKQRRQRTRRAPQQPSE